MSRLSKPERFKAVIGWFEQNMPVAETELHYDNPYELIVAVILSAQCTDKRVNMITPPFFRRYPDAEALAAAEVEDIFELIRSCSYPNNKAKHLSGMARMLVNDFGGVVPDDVETLQRLPGVGRKTANVIASVAFNMPAMAVDTHVHRVSARIGLTYRAKNPLETERQLVKYIPESKLAIAHHWLILHGRYVCIARKPKCSECGLREWCRYYQTKAQDAPRKDAMTQ
ncbi:DNA-(apurinic/apyrimidinic site) lyase [Lentimicrobium saccharophilum]|uniref:Endonuclease III n=1 Tax=Lentimicrobium saccharophilum TaxID=1678841 RepID=A0A0S7C545_9BACT|nr:endonuclease III [Lentimicrobium saccharophilum]GAP44233.1 DNA-(apurinic/apyrimidinic site) lyase [Lentimicrobium saccharophilum]